MKIGLGLYRHMLTRDYYDFARQTGCTHIVAHLVDYFNQGSSNPRNNQPSGAKYEPWGYAGDPDKLWSVEELKNLRREIEDAGLILAAIENLDPAHWHDILLDGPHRPQQIEKVKTIIRRLGEAGIPVLGYNFSLAGVCGRATAPRGRGMLLRWAWTVPPKMCRSRMGRFGTWCTSAMHLSAFCLRFRTMNCGSGCKDSLKKLFLSRSGQACNWLRIPTILPCLRCGSNRAWSISLTCING